MPLKRSSEIKVGLFALIALGAFLVSVLILTSKSSFFRTTITIHSSFSNIAGLIPGSEVRVSGVTVGLVKNINFSPKEGDPTVLVELTIDDRGLDRVAKNSKATIASLGLLGKKYIEIIPGTIEKGLVEDGDFIQGIDPISMSDALDKGGKIMDTIGKTSEHLEVLFASISGQGETQTDLSETITSIRRIASRVETGNGVLHSLIYDAEKTKIVANVLSTTDHIRATAEHVQEIVENVRTGSGTLHELIYGEQFKLLVDNLTNTSEALRQIISDIRTEQGVLYGLIYDPEKFKILEHLQATAANMEDITARIVRGEGTVGGLIIDPTIYEDIKKLTGEVERNRVLKSYIRYVVRQQEEELEEQSEPPANPPSESTPPSNE